MFALQRPVMTDPSRAHWFLGPPSTDPKYNISWRSVNFSVPAAAKFYLDTVVGEAAKEPETAGVFFDGIDGMACVPGGSAALLNDTLATFKQACELLRGAEKGCILSVTNTFSDSAATTRCPVPEEAMVEIMGDTPFFRYYQHWMNGFVAHSHTPTSAATCAAMIENAIAEGARNIPVVVRAPSTASVDAVGFALALGGFLIGAAPGSTFGWGSCWFDECWAWQEIYDRSLGDPLAVAVVSENGLVFSRRYSEADVHVNCSSGTADIAFKIDADVLVPPPHLKTDDTNLSYAQMVDCEAAVAALQYGTGLLNRAAGGRRFVLKVMKLYLKC